MNVSPHAVTRFLGGRMGLSIYPEEMRARNRLWGIGLAAMAIVGAVIAWECGSTPEGAIQKSSGGSVIKADSGKTAGSVQFQDSAPMTDAGAKEKRLAYQAGEQLRQWENEDTPGLRAERSEALEASLRGADMKVVAENLPADVVDFALGLPVFQKWLAADPARAAEWMSHRPEIPETRVASVVHAWEASDSGALTKYLENLPPGAWREQVLTVVARDSAGGDPVQAIEWADQLNPGAVQTGLLRSAVSNWEKKDPASAMQWVSQVNDPGLKDQLAESFAIEYARTDPAGAADYAVQSVQSSEMLNSSIAGIAGIWAEQDPAAAGAWVAQLPGGDGQRTALSELLNVWANKDPAAAITWVNQMPPGPLREQAAKLVETLPVASTDR